MTETIPAKYAAAALRTALKEAFPAARFSVRSGAASITVSWTDGPDTDAVEKITPAYRGATWGGENDGYVPTGRTLTVTIDGREVTGSPLVNHLTVNRSYSPETMAEAAALWSAAHDGTAPADAPGERDSFKVEGKWIRETWAANQVQEIAREVVAPRAWKAAQTAHDVKAAARKNTRTAPAAVEAPARKTRKGTRPRPAGHTVTVAYLPAVGLVVTGTRMRDGSGPVLRDRGFDWDRAGRRWTMHTPDGSQARGVVTALRTAGLTAVLTAPAEDPTPAAGEGAAWATAENIGNRSHQCDATAVHTAPSGARAYVLLDGIGSSTTVAEWTAAAALAVAQAAATHADAAAGLREVYEEHAADPDRQDPYERRYLPAAAAVVAVTAPGRPLTVAWCGDSRAYLHARGISRRLTEDHNLRRVYPPTADRPYGGNRNRITSYLGSTLTDEEAKGHYDHPAVESLTVPLDGPARLILASDGAYEPHTDAGHDLYTELDHEDLADAAREFVDLAVSTSLKSSAALDPAQVHADNATVLLADLTP